MNNDLVKRLLYWPAITKQNGVMEEAADRIEALEARKRNQWLAWRVSNLGRARDE